MEKSYDFTGSSNLIKCDTCREFCSEPIVAWFSKQEMKTEGGSNSVLVGIGQLCQGCFDRTLVGFAKSMVNQESRIHHYEHCSSIINSRMIMDSGRRKKIKDHLTCSVIAFLVLTILVASLVVLFILMSTGILKSRDSQVTFTPQALQRLEDQLNMLTNQTIRNRNEVDAILVNHAQEVTHNMNRTSTMSLKPDSKSRCTHYIPRQQTATAVRETRTSWFPTNQDSSMFISGVTCSVTGGMSSQLVTRQIDNLTQYSCVCPAQTDSSNVIHTCTIHVWSCSSL